MKIIDKLKIANNFSSSEEILRQFILKDNSIIFMEKRDLIKNLHISTSTIYRFCQKLGLKGYDDLRIKLAQEIIINIENDDTSTINFNFPFQPNDNLKSICKNILSIYEYSPKSTFKTLDFIELQKSINIINNANTICIMASNMNVNIMEKFASQLIEIGKNVKISSTPYKWKLETVNLTKNDVLIINSYAGQSSKSFINILPNIVKRGIPIVLIGSVHNTSFIPYATYKLLMCDKEHPTEKLFGFSTSISAQYLLDIIYAAIYQKHYVENIVKHKYIYN